MLVIFLISSDAPVVILLKNISSAILPPIAVQTMSISASFVYRCNSSGKYYANPRDPFDLGIIVIFRSGLECSRNQPATA